MIPRDSSSNLPPAWLKLRWRPPGRSGWVGRLSGEGGRAWLRIVPPGDVGLGNLRLARLGGHALPLKAGRCELPQRLLSANDPPWVRLVVEWHGGSIELAPQIVQVRQIRQVPPSGANGASDQAACEPSE